MRRTITITEEVFCPRCNGKGDLLGYKCLKCEGKGIVILKRVEEIVETEQQEREIIFTIKVGD